MRKTSKRHHTIAKGILRNFCYSGTKFWYYSKNREGEGVCSRDIERKFTRRNYYSILDRFGAFDDSLEVNLFQKMDSRFCELVVDLEKIVLQDSELNIDEESERFVKRFLYYHLKRSPDFNQLVLSKLELERVFAEAFDGYQRLLGPVPKSDFERLTSEPTISDIINHARVRQTAKGSSLIMSRISGMRLALAVAPEGAQFIVGSCAVVRLEEVHKAELGDGNVELWAPVTKNLMIGIFGKSTSPSKAVSKFRLTKGQVRVINQQILKLSTEVASASEPLLRSLVVSREFSMRPHG